MKILGISAFYHDSSACLIDDGQIIAACQEERLTRIKHDANFPHHSIAYCLQQANCSAADIQAIVFYEKPFLKFERLLETYLSFAPKGFLSFLKAMPLWLKEKLFQKKLLHENLQKLGFSQEQCSQILFSNHHLSHAASAFYASPFDEALILTMDGVGEWDTTTVYLGQDQRLEKKLELHFPHSLGLFYSAFTAYCGFKVNSGEYKLMGLAPYGKPIFADTIKKNLIDIKSDGSFRLEMSYFNFAAGLTMTNQKFDELFQHSFRTPDQEIKQVHMDLAASVQTVLEEIIVKICCDLKSKYAVKNLCLAGGVALNCVANGKIKKLDLFDHIWVQPAAGDAGGSLGAALAAYHIHFKQMRKPIQPDLMKGAFLGPRYSEKQISLLLEQKNAVFQFLSDTELMEVIAQKLSEEKVVGWFQGRMEFGPRSLGNRSILGDPRSETMQKIMNQKIKFRESFRPFAPAVLIEDLQEWFEFDQASPYMLMVAPIKNEKQFHTESIALTGLQLINEARSEIPAVTHVDYSSRIQTVHSKTNPRFYQLLQKFKEKTGVPVLINTSFNIRGEPIVCSPADAYKCFMGTQIDMLVLENYVLFKENQPEKNLKSYQHLFELD